MGGIAIKRKVEVIGIFSCITLALFLISINALESPELSLQQTDQQEIVNEISIGLEQEIKEEVVVIQQTQLAQIVHGQSIKDDLYIQEYLRQRNFFENLVYERVNGSTNITLEAGNAITEDIQGVALDGEGYAVHLILCDNEQKACFFRINGIPTGKFIANDGTSADGIQSFDLNEKYVLEIVAIDFDDCGNKRFCDIYWDQKDIVETKIVHKIEE